MARFFFGDTKTHRFVKYRPRGVVEEFVEPLVVLLYQKRGEAEGVENGIFQEFGQAQCQNWAKLEQNPFLYYSWAVASKGCVGRVGVKKRASQEVKRCLVIGVSEISFSFVGQLFLEGLEEACVG